MGAFAGWLRHPAHAPSYHYDNVCRVHGIRANRKAAQRQCAAAPTSELSTQIGGSNVVAVAGIQRRDELLGPLLRRGTEDAAGRTGLDDVARFQEHDIVGNL